MEELSIKDIAKKLSDKIKDTTLITIVETEEDGHCHYENLIFVFEDGETIRIGTGEESRGFYMAD